jgi:hypothetical protein
MTWWQHYVTKEESKKKREFENNGKSDTCMNSQFGQGKRQHKTEKTRLAQLKGGFSAVTQNLEPTKKQTPREMVSLCYQSKV